MSFAYSDTLIDNSFGERNRGMARNKAPTQKWSWSVRHLRPRPKYVVLSAGPHVSELENFTTVLNEVAETHRQSFPNVELIWKTQNPAGCGSHPISDMWKTDGLFAVKQQETSFNWNLFPTFDKLARSFWSGRPRASVLDISATYLRVDSHVGSPLTGGKSRQGPHGCQRGSKRPCVRDCMHFCLPGALQLVPRLLQRHLETLNGNTPAEGAARRVVRSRGDRQQQRREGAPRGSDAWWDRRWGLTQITQ
jgi:hypothetical protein